MPAHTANCENSVMHSVRKMIGFEKDRENGGVKESKFLICEGERIGKLPNKKVISVHPCCMHTKNNLNSTKKKVSKHPKKKKIIKILEPQKIVFRSNYATKFAP